MNPFVILLVVLDVLASAWELWKGHPVKAIYWMAAATLTTTIIFMKEGVS